MVGDNGCPKCGVGLNLSPRQPTIDEALRLHCRVVHARALGRATAPHREGFDFVYMRPVEQMHEPHWWVIVLEGPAQIVKLRPAVWSIKWAHPLVTPHNGTDERLQGAPGR